MDVKEFAGRIDHTLLDKRHSLDDIDRAVRDARNFGMNLCVPPDRVGYVRDLGFPNELVTVVGFPEGYNSTEVKEMEAREALRNGATEIDVACNLNLLGDREKFLSDVGSVTDLGCTVKAIIETPLLSPMEVRRASWLCVEGGVDYVKTCTGFHGDVGVEDVRLVSESVGGEVGVKASGGVGSHREAVGLLEAGASRIGASSGVELVRGYRESA